MYLMIEEPVKIYFEPLPFGPHIEYFTLNHNSRANHLNDSCENESEKKSKENIGFNNKLYNESSFFQSLPKNSHRKKSSVKMNERAKNFQYSFYKIFTTRKKFPKKFVVLIHNAICANLNLRKVNRDEIRSIYLYFADFAQNSEKILLFIKNNKNEIIRKLPQLRAIMS